MIMRQGLERLVQLYEATSRPEKAAEWNEKLEAFDKAYAAHKSGKQAAASATTDP